MKDANQNAFPESEREYDQYKEEYITTFKPGLSIREYFAAKAMIGILSADGFAERLATEGGEKTLLKTICTASVMAADLLINELNK